MDVKAELCRWRDSLTVRREVRNMAAAAAAEIDRLTELAYAPDGSEQRSLLFKEAERRGQAEARAERAEAAIENEAIVTRELTARAEQAEREVGRLSGGLIAISEAPKTVGSSILRTIAYDIALNCIDAETARYQIRRRAGIDRDEQG